MILSMVILGSVSGAPDYVPELLDPGDGSGVYGSPSFDWSNVVGSYYSLYIDDDPGFGSPVIVSPISPSNHDYSGDLDPGVYSWKVENVLDDDPFISFLSLGSSFEILDPPFEVLDDCSVSMNGTDLSLGICFIGGDHSNLHVHFNNNDLGSGNGTGDTYILFDNSTNTNITNYINSTGINYTVGDNGSLILGNQTVTFVNWSIDNSTIEGGAVINSTLINTSVVVGNTSVLVGDTSVLCNVTVQGDEINVSLGNTSVLVPIDLFNNITVEGDEINITLGNTSVLVPIDLFNNITVEGDEINITLGNTSVLVPIDLFNNITVEGAILNVTVEGDTNLYNITTGETITNVTINEGDHNQSVIINEGDTIINFGNSLDDPLIVVNLIKRIEDELNRSIHLRFQVIYLKDPEPIALYLEIEDLLIVSRLIESNGTYWFNGSMSSFDRERILGVVLVDNQGYDHVSFGISWEPIKKPIIPINWDWFSDNFNFTLILERGIDYFFKVPFNYWILALCFFTIALTYLHLYHRLEWSIEQKTMTRDELRDEHGVKSRHETEN